MISNIKRLSSQVLKFGFTGVLCTIIDFGILILLTEVFNIVYEVSAVISFSVSVIINYILSTFVVFDVKEKSNKNLIPFILLSICGLGINELIMIFFEQIWGIEYYFGKVVATCVVMIFNYITRKKLLE